VPLVTHSRTDYRRVFYAPYLWYHHTGTLSFTSVKMLRFGRVIIIARAIPF
jgi:hypothetical protein